MDEQSVREHAQAHCEALLSGDIGQASQSMSRELQANLGPFVAMLPLPLTSATIESVEMTGKAYRAILHLTGDAGEIRLETRWKERDDKPTMIEASHIPEAPAAVALEADGEEQE